jgi:hypothetical protein
MATVCGRAVTQRNAAFTYVHVTGAQPYCY